MLNVMSRKNEIVGEEHLNYGCGYAVNDNSPEYLVGRVLQIIEILGLQGKQEQSIKGLIREAIYDEFCQRGVYLKSSLYTTLRKTDYKKKEENQGVPYSGIDLNDIK